MNNFNTMPDKDSMMALEALLKIRSDCVAESSQLSPPKAAPQRNSAFSVPAPSFINMTQHFIPMQVVSAHPTYPATQSGIAPPTTLLKAADQGQENIYPSRASLNTTPALCTPPLTPPLTNPAGNMAGLAMRQNKINDALHSKPQRGRKRENLSVMERMELTRTRNREHAKSTRVRKKARYQELVDKEVLYDELKNAADLDNARVDAIVSFIDSREKLLCCSVTSSSTSSRSDELREALDKTLHNRATFTLDVQGGCPLAAAPTSVTASSSAETVDAMTRMSKLEEVIRCKVARQFGKNAVSQLGYSVVGGRDAIAVTKSGVAMVELSVVLANNSTTNLVDAATIMTAMIRWTFAPQSEHLMGMQWTTIVDTLAYVDSHSTTTAANSSKSGHDLLGIQTCYPSVVSLLDHGVVHCEVDKSAVSPGQSPTQSPKQSPRSPGMNI